MEPFPEIITHNYDPGRGPCRNICALPDADAERILDAIKGAGGRSIKPDYLARRRATEEWLIQERRRMPGTPALARPVYFFLGDFADGKDASRPASLIMALRAFPPDTLTFTYPDSMASLAIASSREHDPHRKPYHGRVFTLAEIRAVVADYGMPDCRSKTDPALCYDRFIEVQVWDDAPIRAYLAAPSASS